MPIFEAIMKKFIPLLLLLTFVSASAKLTQFIVRGYTVKQDYSKADWYRESVDSVFVGLVKNDTIPVDFRMLSGDDSLKMTTSSEFRLLVKGGVGDYTIFLNKSGYEPLRHDFRVVSEGQDVVNLRSMPMEARRENTLSEVEVVGTAIKMVMKGDTIVYDSRAFMLPEGSTLEGLVSQLPGAQLDADGSITVNGKKVSSLLLNGNDFFQGDPDVALKNLPAYTVDKIKVYDKAEKDDNVSLSSQKLSSAPSDENIVMDVTLKKEFSMATILSVEGGYGPGIYNKESPKRTDSRYLGRAFAIGFGKTYRWATYGGYNNIHNSSKASSSNKDWGYNWSDDDGDGTVAVAGLNAFYNPSKKLEIGGSINYQRDDINNESLTSTTRFFDTGNLYQRSSQSTSALQHSISFNSQLNYLGDHVTILFMPRVYWWSKNQNSVALQANFSENPLESRRGEALDSLFSGHAPRRFADILTSATYSASNFAPYSDRLKVGGLFNVTWRPTKGRGLFRMSASGDTDMRKKNGGEIYTQPFTSNPADAPISREQWSTFDSHRDNWGANITYEWDKKIIGEKWIHTFEAEPAVGYDIDRQREDNALLADAAMADVDPASRPLPSVTAPENLRPLLSNDPNNTYRILDLKNEMMGRVRLAYIIELSAPSDSGFNPKISFSANFTHRQYWRHYTISKPYADFAFGKNDCRPTEMAGGNINFSSNNKAHYFYMSLGCGYLTDLPSISALVPSMTNQDPLNVYLGPEGNMSLPAPHTYSASFYANYNGNKTHQHGFMSAYYSRYENKLAQSSVFDPATGITTYRPMTVNGNWDVRVYGGYSIPFGLLDCWNIGLNLDYRHDNSVDYVASIGQPERSVVKTNEIGGDAIISYKFKNGTRVGVGGTTMYARSTSPRAGFQTLSSWHSKAFAAVTFYLPWEIEGETTLNAVFRRGYQDSALNTTDWLWNASVQKSILKGALTFKLQAVDILGQLSTIEYRVNAQGRTETWNNTLPRYVMFSVAYRFNFMPKAMK